MNKIPVQVIAVEMKSIRSRKLTLTVETIGEDFFVPRTMQKFTMVETDFVLRPGNMPRTKPKASLKIDGKSFSAQRIARSLVLQETGNELKAEDFLELLKQEIEKARIELDSLKS